jgi:hypothetical protein
VAEPETLLRLIQSVPSHKAEPIKLWLAKVGYVQEMADPEPSLLIELPRHGRSTDAVINGFNKDSRKLFTLAKAD